MQLIDALNLSDRELLARTLMAEAGNGSINDMLPVGNVIMNRARQGGTLQDVILAPAQFSPWNTTKMPDGSMLYAAGKGQGRDMGGIKPSNSAYEVADLLLSGEASDVTEGATHFFNPSISKPSWAKGMAGTKIGSHLFGSAGGFRTGAPKIQTQQPLSATSGIGGGSLLSKEPEMSMNPNTPPRSGLLGFMDIMRQQDPETGMTAMERFGAALDPLVRPNERMGEQFRASGARRLQTQSKNKTIETLRQRAQAGDQLAMMVLQGLESGAYDAKTAMSLYMGKKLEAPKDTRTSQIKNYEYWISKGKAPAEAEALVKSGQTIQIGGAAGAEEEFYKKKYEKLGTEFAKIQQRAGQAGANNLTINALKQLYQVAPSGPVQGRLAELFPEANDISTAVQSLRTQLAPQLRVEGSGSTSDIEYAGMLNSLGSLKNSPEANAALLDLMLVKNEILQKKSEIATRVGMPEEQGGLTIQQAEIAMLDIDRQMWSENAMVTSIQQLIDNAGGFTASSDGNTITTSGGLTVQFE